MTWQDLGLAKQNALISILSTCTLTTSHSLFYYMYNVQLQLELDMSAAQRRFILGSVTSLPVQICTVRLYCNSFDKTFLHHPFNVFFSFFFFFFEIVLYYSLELSKPAENKISRANCVNAGCSFGRYKYLGLCWMCRTSEKRANTSEQTDRWIGFTRTWQIYQRNCYWSTSYYWEPLMGMRNYCAAAQNI